MEGGRRQVASATQATLSDSHLFRWPLPHIFYATNEYLHKLLPQPICKGRNHYFANLHTTHQPQGSGNVVKLRSRWSGLAIPEAASSNELVGSVY